MSNGEKTELSCGDRPTVALIGPPNVGKSSLFSALTGMDVEIANYSGTTVEYKRGRATFDNHEVTVVDIPGTYSLSASNEAEQLAIDALEEGCDVVICVLDAVNFESSLHLFFEVQEYDIPVVAAINRVDLLANNGQTLEIGYLRRELSSPVVETIATEQQGIDRLSELVTAQLTDSSVHDDPPAEKWEQAEKLATAAIRETETNNTEPSKLDHLSQQLVQPWPGIPVAFLVLVGTFAIVVGVGMGIRQYVLLPVFEAILFPAIEQTVQSATSSGTIQGILIGEYGFLIKSIEWPFGLVLPYVLSFYIALSLLEDSGYLPRLAVLLDGVMDRIGLTGTSTIPLMLGYGCAIPGITATRSAKTQKRRIMMTLMIVLAVPCVAQTGAFIALLGEASLLLVPAVFLMSLLGMIVSGLILDSVLDGPSPPTITDVPPLLVPNMKVTATRVWMRIKHFVLGGAVHMMYAIGAASVLYELGALQQVGKYMRPIVVEWLHLPEEAAIPLILGIVRRELTVLPLIEMDLTTSQLFVSSVVALFYVPCVAVFATVVQEYSSKMAIFILFLTVLTSFLIGGIFAQVLALV